MAQLDVRRLYRSNAVLTQQDIDAFINDIETFFNLTKLNNDNIQDASIDVSTTVAAGTISTAKLDNQSITTTKIPDDAITTAKIADEAITTVKILDDNVTTAKIVDAAITTAKIVDNAITPEKLTAANITSSSNISFSTTSTSATYVTGSELSITTSGRPVMLIFQPNTTNGYIRAAAGTEDRTYTNLLKIKRDTTSGGSFSTLVAHYQFYRQRLAFTIAMNEETTATIIHLDTPAAGTWYYRLYANTGATSTTLSLVGKFTLLEL